MPIYQYGCTNCGLVLEKLQRMDALEPECPDCRGAGSGLVYMVKQVTSASFRLKGDGWYAPSTKSGD